MNVCVQIFTRPPVPGECKTRLIPALGATGAAELNATMTQAMVQAARDTEADRVELHFSPSQSLEGPGEFLCDLALRYGLALVPQRGANLGVRMRNAIKDSVDQGCSSILIGTDCPQHAFGALDEAVMAIRAGVRTLFRPASDGGYVCVGMHELCAEVFDGIEWGTAGVMEQTRHRLVQSGCGWLELGLGYDVDTPEDLCHVPRSWLL